MKFLLTSAGITNNDIAKGLSDLNLLFIPTAANTIDRDKVEIVGKGYYQIFKK